MLSKLICRVLPVAVLILFGGMCSSVHALLDSRPTQDYTAEKRARFERIAGNRVAEFDAMPIQTLIKKMRKVKTGDERRLLSAALDTRKPSTKKELEELFDAVNSMVLTYTEADEDSDVLFVPGAAADAILHTTDLRLAPEVIKHINHGNEFARNTAIKWVAWNNVKDAVPELIDFVKDGSAREEKLNPGRFEVRDNAVEALGKLGDERTIPALMGALKWTSSASFALSQFGMKVAPDLVKLHKSLTSDSDSQYRYHVRLTLKFMRDKAAAPLMWELLKGDLDGLPKEYPAAMLENTCDASTTPTLSEVDAYLISLYQKRGWFSDLVVDIAVRTSRIDLLVAVIGKNSTDSSVRTAAANGLIKLHAVSAVKELEKLYNASAPYTSKRLDLATALKGITGKEYSAQ